MVLLNGLPVLLLNSSNLLRVNAKVLDGEFVDKLLHQLVVAHDIFCHVANEGFLQLVSSVAQT